LYRGEPRRKESLVGSGIFEVLYGQKTRWERERRLDQWPQLGEEDFLCSAIQISFGRLCAAIERS